MAKRSKSSERWLARQRRDPFARDAREQGLGSRAHYKLEEIAQRFRLLRPTMIALELGAAPGGWTRYLEQRVATVVAVDTLPVAAGARTRVLQGSFGEAELDRQLEAVLLELSDDSASGRPLDLVLSDMAPNISGIRTADQARAMELADLAVEAASRWLKPDGAMLVKVFQGEGLDAWRVGLRTLFGSVGQVKPRASRAESRELYVLARGYRGA